MPLLSILLPTYNGAKYLDEQMDSILAQTVDDFELIAIDDGSNDGTPELLADYAARDRRIRVVPSQGNIGQVNRLFQLAGQASGEFVAIADQDDIWDLDRNDKLLTAIGDKGMAYGRSELIDGEGAAIGRTLLDMLHTSGSAGNLEALIMPRFSAHGSLLRRSWMNIASFGHTLPFDWLMGLEASFSTGAVYVDDAIVRHRIHGNNQMNRLNLEKRKFDVGYIRWLLLFRTPMRLRFWMVSEFLSRSPVLTPAVRKNFKHVADRVLACWYSEWRGLRPRNKELYRVLTDNLGPYASSAEDLEFFQRKANVMTGMLVSGATVNEVKLRHNASGNMARARSS